LLGTNDEIFSEEMFLFTLRSFGAFYFSRTVRMVPVLFAKSMTPTSQKRQRGVKMKHLDGTALSLF
jgi:hypothetical protein